LSQINPELNEQENILRLISDPYARKIIDSIRVDSKSAIQISHELDIDLCSIYRRLHKFQKYDLLKTTFQITSTGKKSFYYKSKIRSIVANYRQGKFDINLDFGQT
jgi:hypothetical protein